MNGSGSQIIYLNQSVSSLVTVQRISLVEERKRRIDLNMGKRRKFNKFDLSEAEELGTAILIYEDKKYYFDLEDYEKIKGYCWYKHHNYLVRLNATS